jgi:hypothetical protein
MKRIITTFSNALRNKLSRYKHEYPQWVKDNLTEWKIQYDDSTKTCRIFGHYWRRQGTWDFDGQERSVYTCRKCGHEKLR